MNRHPVPIHLQPVVQGSRERTYRHGTLVLAPPGLVLSADVHGDVEVIFARTLRRLGALVFVIRLDDRRVRYAVMLGGAVSAEGFLEAVRRATARAMFQLLPHVRAAVQTPDDVWQPVACGGGRRSGDGC